MSYFVIFYIMYILVYVLGGIIIQSSIKPRIGMPDNDYLTAVETTEKFRVWWWCLGLLLLFTLPTIGVILKMLNIF